MDMGQDATHLFIVERGNVCVEEDYLQQSQDEQLVPFPDGLITRQRNRLVLSFCPDLGLMDPALVFGAKGCCNRLESALYLSGTEAPDLTY